MDNRRLAAPDKENNAPRMMAIFTPAQRASRADDMQGEDSGVHYPALPCNIKGNIFVKQPSVNVSVPLLEPKNTATPNVARKRRRLSALRSTPPRPSHHAQMKKIFGSDKPLDTSLSSPVIPPDALQLFQHFHQALRSTNTKDGEDYVANDSGRKSKALIDCYSSDTDSDSSDDGGVQAQDSSMSTPEKTSFIPKSPRKSHDQMQTQSHDSRSSASMNHVNVLERAIARSFPSSLTRFERRRTLNIDLHGTAPPPSPVRGTTKAPVAQGATESSSTEDWTGDEIFFPRRDLSCHHTNYIRTPNAAPRSPLVTGLSANRSMPHTRHLPPITQQQPIPTHLRTSRFCRPCRSNMNGQVNGRDSSRPSPSVPTAGIPLCMEEHPPSVSSDADDEKDSD